MAEAVALHLVEADLDHELRPHCRLLELTASPAVGLGEAAVGRLGEKRQHAGGYLLARASGDRAGADVVEPAVFAVEAEQQRRERLGGALPANPDHDAVGRAVLLDLGSHRIARGRADRRGRGAVRDHPVETEGLEAVEPRAGLRLDRASRAESLNPCARRSSSARRSRSGWRHRATPSREE